MKTKKRGTWGYEDLKWGKYKVDIKQLFDMRSDRKQACQSKEQEGKIQACLTCSCRMQTDRIPMVASNNNKRP